MINDMKQRGMSITQIAEELERGRKTIRIWLHEGAPACYNRKVAKPRKLDPFYQNTQLNVIFYTFDTIY